MIAEWRCSNCGGVRGDGPTFNPGARCLCGGADVTCVVTARNPPSPKQRRADRRTAQRRAVQQDRARLELQVSALSKLVRAEFPASRGLGYIVRTWGAADADLTPEEIGAFDDQP